MEENGSDVLQNVKIFSNCSSFLMELITDEAQRLPERQARGDSYFSNSQKKVTYHGHDLIGCPEKAIRTCATVYRNILQNLKDSLVVRLESVCENPLLIYMAKFLDARNYQFSESEDFFDDISEIFKTFKALHKANVCVCVVSIGVWIWGVVQPYKRFLKESRIEQNLANFNCNEALTGN